MLVSNLIAIIFILEILDYNARAINQLIQDQFEINDKISDTDKKLKIEELKQVNLPFEIQSYMDYLLKENKEQIQEKNKQQITLVPNLHAGTCFGPPSC